MRNRFPDFAHLLFSYSQLTHLDTWININFQFLKQFSSVFDHLFIIDAKSLFRFPADEDVLCNRQVVNHVQFLMNDNNPGLLCFSCIMKLDFFAFINDCSRIFRINTGQNFHKRRFSGTIFSHERMYFTASDLKVNMIQCVYSGKRLIDSLHFQNYVAHLLLLYIILRILISFFCVSQRHPHKPPQLR